MDELIFTSTRDDRARDGKSTGGAALDDLLAGEGAEQEVDEEAYWEDEDDEGPLETLLREHGAEIEAGLVPGWKLDRTHPGVLVGPPRPGGGTSHRSTAAATGRLAAGSR